MKVTDPEGPVASSRDCPYPCHAASFQPSPHESVISRRHSDPSAILMHCENGAPPDKLLPSRQESVHPTSDPYEPAVTWMLSCRSTVSPSPVLPPGSHNGDRGESGGEGEGKDEGEPATNGKLHSPKSTILCNVNSHGLHRSIGKYTGRRENQANTPSPFCGLVFGMLDPHLRWQWAFDKLQIESNRLSPLVPSLRAAH